MLVCEKVEVLEKTLLVVKKALEGMVDVCDVDIAFWTVEELDNIVEEVLSPLQFSLQSKYQ